MQDYSVIEAENPLYLTEPMALAGTPDVICKHLPSDKYTIVDWKTSTGTYAEHVLQCAAYALMYEEKSGIRVDRAHIVRFPKTGEAVEQTVISDLTEAKHAFTAVFLARQQVSEVSKLLKKIKKENSK